MYDLEVEHNLMVNEGVNIATDADERLERYRYAYRNEMYLHKREGFKGMLYVTARTIAHVSRVLLHARSRRMYRIGIILGSTLEGVRFNPQIERI